MLDRIYAHFLEKRRRENLLKRGNSVAPCPILSVGNITTGGTGKTPTVQWVARFLEAQNLKVGVACRGYKGALSEKGALVTSDSSAQEVGDEALLHARNLPGAVVAICKKREKAVRICVKNGAQIVILDDGFQYWSLPRAFELVLLDAQKPFGPNGKLLPLGRLREEPKSLNRADAILVTRSEKADRVVLEKQIRGFCEAPIFYSIHAPIDLKDEKTGEIWELETLHEFSFLALAGLANNVQFFTSLEKYEPLETIGKSDHFNWRNFDFEGLRTNWNVSLLREAKAAIPLVTTEKDAVKFPLQHLSDPIFSLRIGLQIEREAELQNLILAKLRAQL